MAGRRNPLVMGPKSLLVYLGLFVIVMINAFATKNIPNEWPYIRAILIGIIVIFVIRYIWKRVKKKKAISMTHNRNAQPSKPYDEWE